jgi:hypothetical protein
MAIIAENDGYPFDLPRSRSKWVCNAGRTWCFDSFDIGAVQSSRQGFCASPGDPDGSTFLLDVRRRRRHEVATHGASNGWYPTVWVDDRLAVTPGWTVGTLPGPGEYAPTITLYRVHGDTLLVSWLGYTGPTPFRGVPSLDPKSIYSTYQGICPN